MAAAQMTEEFCGCELKSAERYFPDEAVLPVLRVTVVLGYALVVSWCAVLWRQRWSIMFLVKSCCVTWWQSGGTSRDEVEEEVDEVLSANRVRRGWIIFSFSTVVAIPFFIVRSVGLHVSGVWGTADHDTLRVVLFDEPLVGFTLWFVVLSLVYLRGRCSNFEFTILMVILQCSINLNTWTATNTAVLILRIVLFAVVRVLFAVVSKVPLVLLLNVLFSLSMLARLHWSSVSHATINFMTIEFAISLVVTVGSAFSDALMRRETKAVLQATCAARSERTAQELLSLVCDAVFTLDGSFSLQGSSPALGALLFNTSPHPFFGVAFSELVWDDDRDRVREFLVGSTRPACMHLHLLDASGARVAAQLFHTCLEGLRGEVSHVIGIREDMEGQLFREPPVCPDDMTRPPAGITLGAAQCSTGNEDLVSLSSVESDCLECSCIVDALSDDLTLLACSPCFTAISGPVQGGAMVDWVNGDPLPFRVWIQQSVNQMMNGSDTRPMSVGLKPSHSRLVGPVRAVCDVSPVPINNIWNADAIPVKIVFSNLSKEGDRKKTSKNGTRPGGVRHLSM